MIYCFGLNGSCLLLIKTKPRFILCVNMCIYALYVYVHVCMYACVYNSERAHRKPIPRIRVAACSGYLLPDFSSTNCRCCWLMVEGWDGVGSSRDECAQGETVWWISCTRNWSGSLAWTKRVSKNVWVICTDYRAPHLLSSYVLTNRGWWWWWI